MRKMVVFLCLFRRINNFELLLYNDDDYDDDDIIKSCYNIAFSFKNITNGERSLPLVQHQQCPNRRAPVE